MLSKTEYEKLIGGFNTAPETITIKMFKALLDSLYVRQVTVDPNLTKIINMTSDELIATKDLDILDKYLWALTKFRSFLRNEISIRQIYFSLDIKKDYENLLRDKRMRDTRKKDWKTLSAQEDYLVATDTTLEKKRALVEVANMYNQLLEGFIDDVESLIKALNKIIYKREKEFESELKTRG